MASSKTAAGRSAAASSASTASSAPRRTSGIPTSSTTTIPVDAAGSSPEEGYHFTVDITDKAISFIQDAKAIAPDKPFFLYYCPGAAHAPHHVPKEWADKYKGKFDMGYEAYRELVFANQKKLGIVAEQRRALADQPVHRPEERRRPGLGRARRRAALGLAHRRREEAVLAHGGGLRRAS